MTTPTSRSTCRSASWWAPTLLPLAAALCLPATAGVAPASVDIQPGPRALNGPPPRAPQLENTGPWRARPLLVSGASAYRQGEFLYQDFLYDDRGATTNASTAGTTNLARSGRYTYPTNVAAYFENAADFVEVRLKLTDGGTAFRITYNSMSDPALVAATLALGGTAGTPRHVPYGANAAMPADVFVTVNGARAFVNDAVSGALLATLPVSTDLERRQVQVVVPHASWDPRGRTARVGAATGLWDTAAQRYLIPGTTATATTPGGSGTNVVNPPAFFNVAFRYNEPDPSLSTFTRWRDGVQGNRLATSVTIDGLQTHDLSDFGATVDFVKLASGIDDDLPGQPGGTPVRGFLNRLYAASYEVMQGVGNPAAPDLTKARGCTPTSTLAANGTTSCVPQFAGRLQPYSVYVPTVAPPASGYGLVTDLHGAGDNYNRNPPVTAERIVGLGERGTGSLVYITQGRGGAYWWWGQAGAEIFEVMADIRRNYPVDTDWVVASGISQGGYGSWKQATMFPDLYAGVAPHVPCPSAGTGYNGSNAPGGADSFAWPMLDSLRHVPTIASAGESDGTCQWTGAQGNQAVRAKLEALGYPYEFWSFPGMGHQFAMAACGTTSQPPCAYSFAPDYLGTRRRVTNPHRVTYAVNEGWNEPLFNLVGDHAYWISGVRVRDAAASPYGRVDVISRGFGLEDAPANPTQMVTLADYALGANISYHTYNKWTRAVSPPVNAVVRDQVDIRASNIARLVIDPVRARLSCNAVVNVLESDGPVDVVLHGCLVGDVDLDDKVGCADVEAVKAALGSRKEVRAYNFRADLDDNGVIDLLDLRAIKRLLPPTSPCSK